MLVAQIIGGIYASALILLAAMGLLIVFGNMGIINLAHGEFLMIGAYVVWVTYQEMQLPFAIALILSFVITGAIGALLEWLVMRRFQDQVEETLLVTYALSIIMKEVVRLIFGTSTHMVESPFGSGRFEIGSIVLPYYNIFVIVMAIVFILLTYLLFYCTSVGKKMRAIKQNRTMAECVGINTNTIDILSFSFGTGLSGLAGAILAVATVVSTSMGSSYMIDGISTVVMGGLDSLVGTAISAVLIGESTNILGGFMNQVLAKVIVLFGVIMVLRFKPNGLFSREQR